MLNCRRAMEFAIKWMYSVDGGLVMPYDDRLDVYKRQPEECVITATAASSHVIQAVGANAGMCSYTQLQTFIRENPRPVIRYRCV